MEVVSRRRWLVLGAIALSTLTVGLDTTVLNVALPTLARELGADSAALQWFATAYTLTLAALMIPAGTLGDRFGRKRLFVAALAVFGVASLGCALAQSPGQLIAARIVLGIGAAALMPLSTAVIAVLFPEPAERGRAVGVSMTMVMLGMPLGPILGGLLLRNFWWGSVFLINLPMVAICLLAVGAMLPESRSATPHPVHLPGIALSSAGLFALTYGFIRAGDRGWSDAAAWVSVAAGAALLAVFVLHQRRAAHPVIDLGLFAHDGFRWGAVYSVFMSFAMFGVMFTIPQYMQAVLGADAFGSGLRQLPMVGGLMGAKLLTGRLTGRRALLVGFALLAAGAAIGSATTAHSPYWFAACWIAIAGLGLGIVMPASVAMAVGALTRDRAGSGSALLNSLRQAGGTIGVAVLGTVLATRYHGALGDLNHPPFSEGVSPGVAAAAGDSAMVEHVREAFMSGTSSLLWACAGICMLALGTLVTARIRAKNARPEPHREEIGVASTP
ncbi:EmrB/QacA subfamily drug resistance transporter [Nocardia transvalensis]|uniref:EmrB/QacA subfamily drug resistance transporter n=1 Tax=Nocardia transvalensis TaxID=37333 RepID=A0A7W9PMG9_9NOCA|nr:DHA2 family efflux MFS transporter permease subunit [Nocardia transvalensis]MBB5918203.1 EmrB/QacA subfamily drug resistance transporter [Nocardia transvalensis]